MIHLKYFISVVNRAMDKGSSCKRLRTSDGYEPPLKRKKTTEQDENDPERNDITQNDQSEADEDEESPLKLDDLNDYCLEGVFKHLSFKTLMNVADSSNRFVEEVRFAARRIFRVKKVEIDYGNVWIETLFLFDWCELNGVHKLLRFFEVFGTSIFKLTVNPRGYYHRLQLVEELILKYCTKRLINLDMINIQPWQEVLVHINKQFEVLQFLNIGGTLSETFNFNEWFPVLHSLKLNNSFRCFKSVQHTFSMLQQLDIDYLGQEIDDIKEIIRVNPELKVFKFYTYIISVQNMWQFVNEYLPQLEYLVLKRSSISEYVIYSKLFQILNFCGVEFLPITTLKELTISQYVENEIDRFLDLVCKNTNLLKLRVWSYRNYVLHDDQITMIIQSLPQLTEIRLEKAIITADHLIRILAGCKSLQTLQLRQVNKFDVQPFLNATIASGWRMHEKLTMDWAVYTNLSFVRINSR